MTPKPTSNSKLTLLRKLNKKKYREREQLFLVEGVRAVQQVIENKKITVEELFYDETQTGWQHKHWKKTAEQFPASIIKGNDFTEVSDTENPQAVIALCKMPKEIDLEKLAKKKGIILASDRIQDPGNMGTMIRTAAWLGVKGILAGKGTVDLFHPKVVRGTAGTTGLIPYQKVNLKQTLPILEKKGWQVVLLDASKRSEDLRNISQTARMIVIIGNEANGIDSELFKAGRIAAHIPSKTHETNVESLNASIALAVALYEFL